MFSDVDGIDSYVETASSDATGEHKVALSYTSCPRCVHLRYLGKAPAKGVSEGQDRLKPAVVCVLMSGVPTASPHLKRRHHSISEVTATKPASVPKCPLRSTSMNLHMIADPDLKPSFSPLSR